MFYSEKELILSEGIYEVSVTIACSFDNEDILGSQYSKSVSTEITAIS